MNDNYKKTVLEACAASALSNLNDYIERVKVVSTLDNPELLESANRVLRITKDVETGKIDPALLKETAEKDLFAQVGKINENVDYTTYLAELVAINPAVVKFFEDVLVMDKDEKVKANRLALLSLLRDKYNHLTNFAKL